MDAEIHASRLEDKKKDLSMGIRCLGGRGLQVLRSIAQMFVLMLVFAQI
jgi:hypothetical protein